MPADDYLTLPTLAASHGVTPDEVRRAVRRRLPELLADGLVVLVAGYKLVPAARADALLDALSAGPAGEDS